MLDHQVRGHLRLRFQITDHHLTTQQPNINTPLGNSPSYSQFCKLYGMPFVNSVNVYQALISQTIDVWSTFTLGWKQWCITSHAPAPRSIIAPYLSHVLKVYAVQGSSQQQSTFTPTVVECSFQINITSLIIFPPSYKRTFCFKYNIILIKTLNYSISYHFVLHNTTGMQLEHQLYSPVVVTTVPAKWDDLNNQMGSQHGTLHIFCSELQLPVKYYNAYIHTMHIYSKILQCIHTY